MDEVVRAANVFERPLKSVEPEEGAARGDVAVGNENEGAKGERLDEESELYECDLDEMGTVKLCRLGSDSFV